MATPIINVGPQDAQLTLNTALPAVSTNVNTGILDLEANGGNSNAWRMGRFAIYFPNLPENNTGAGITVTMSCANSSLTNSSPAPAPAVPGTFAQPAVSQIATLSSVGVTGSAATVLYMTPAFDNTGSTFQFYQFNIAVPAGVITQGENVVIAWVKDSP